MYSYVVEDPETKEITDMVSFYSLPSSILGNDKHSLLRAAYCYYLFANKTSLTDLLNDALILAKRLDFDVFNALEIGENDRFLQAARHTAACDLPFRLQPGYPRARHLDSGTTLG